MDSQSQLFQIDDRVTCHRKPSLGCTGVVVNVYQINSKGVRKMDVRFDSEIKTTKGLSMTSFKMSSFDDSEDLLSSFKHSKDKSKRPFNAPITHNAITTSSTTKRSRITSNLSTQNEQTNNNSNFTFTPISSTTITQSTATSAPTARPFTIPTRVNGRGGSTAQARSVSSVRARTNDNDRIHNAFVYPHLCSDSDSEDSITMNNIESDEDSSDEILHTSLARTITAVTPLSSSQNRTSASASRSNSTAAISARVTPTLQRSRVTAASGNSRAASSSLLSNSRLTTVTPTPQPATTTSINRSDSSALFQHNTGDAAEEDTYFMGSDSENEGDTYTRAYQEPPDELELPSDETVHVRDHPLFRESSADGHERSSAGSYDVADGLLDARRANHSSIFRDQLPGNQQRPWHAFVDTTPVSTVHETEWFEAGEVRQDASSGVNFEARFVWQGDGARKTFQTRRAIDYFDNFMPAGLMQQIEIATNQRLVEKEKAQLSNGEMLLWIGLKLAMIVDHRTGPRGVYWETDSTHKEGDTIFQASNYGDRFGMSKNRFEAISNAFHLAPHPTFGRGATNNDGEMINLDVADPWFEIRYMIYLFNKSRMERVIPGKFLCVDESMSFWKGLELLWSVDGLPHSSKQPRKPANEGIEFKTMADAETGVMMALDLLEGQAVQATKRFRDEVENSGTAYVLRLCEPWFGSGRVVVADSAFSSVSTLIHCDRRGLHFIGVVKTASKRFPKLYLKCWYDERTNDTRGTHKVLTSTYKHPGEQVNHKMHVLCWQDARPKMIVFSAGTTLRGHDSVRPRVHKVIGADGIERDEKYKLRVHQPDVIEKLFKAFGAIDHHDQMRQGFLCPETSWLTKVWWKRVFASILGIIMTDAYLAYRYEYMCAHGSVKNVEPFRQFSGKLVMQLINRARGVNDEPNTTPPVNGGQQQQSLNNSAALSNDRHLKKRPLCDPHPVAKIFSVSEKPKHHVLWMNKKIPPHGFSRQKGSKTGGITCTYCQKDAYSHCAKCSNYDLQKIVAICSSETMRDCYEKHMEQCSCRH